MNPELMSHVPGIVENFVKKHLFDLPEVNIHEIEEWP